MGISPVGTGGYALDPPATPPLAGGQAAATTVAKGGDPDGDGDGDTHGRVDLKA